MISPPEDKYKPPNETWKGLNSLKSLGLKSNGLFHTNLKFTWLDQNTKYTEYMRTHNEVEPIYFATQGSSLDVLISYSIKDYTGFQAFDYYWIPYNPVYNDDSTRTSKPITLLSYGAEVCITTIPQKEFDFSQYNPGYGKLKLVQRSSGYYDEISVYDYKFNIK